MKYIKQFFKRIKTIDVLTVLLLLFALGLAGYVSIERTQEMNDVDGMYTYTAEEDQNVRQNDFEETGI